MHCTPRALLEHNAHPATTDWSLVVRPVNQCSGDVLLFSWSLNRNSSFANILCRSRGEPPRVDCFLRAQGFSAVILQWFHGAQRVNSRRDLLCSVFVHGEFGRGGFAVRFLFAAATGRTGRKGEETRCDSNVHFIFWSMVTSPLSIGLGFLQQEWSRT